MPRFKGRMMQRAYEHALRAGKDLDLTRKRSGAMWAEAYRKGYRGDYCRWPKNTMAYACYAAGVDARKTEE